LIASDCHEDESILSVTWTPFMVITA